MFYAEFLPYVRDYYNVVTGGGIHWNNERYQSLLWLVSFSFWKMYC